MLVRLSNSGFIEYSEPLSGEIPTQLTKRARLVYCGDFESMDGPVSVKEEHLQKICNAYNGKLAKLKRLALGNVSVGNLPPVQLDHTRSARDTVGRLENTDLTVEDWTDEDGKTRKALYGHVRFLGRDNVERVLDGRWSTLSIGANFEDGKLDELTVTPFPAAEKASLLSARLASEGYIEVKQPNGSVIRYSFDEFRKITKSPQSAFIQEVVDRYIKAGGNAKIVWNFSRTDKESIMKLALYQRLRKYLKLKKKMSDEQVEEKMNKLAEEENEEELKKLAEEAEKDEEKKEMSGDDDDEDKKKLAEEEEEKKKEHDKKMSAAKETITRLGADFRAKRDAASLAAKAAAVGSRLSAIRASGRITPAEVKKVNVKELAGKSQEAIDAVLKTYEDRQPVIMAGQLGSMKAMSLKEIERAGNQAKSMSRLEAETRKNMSLLASTVKEDGENKAPSFSDKRLAMSQQIELPTADIASMEADYNEICSMLDGGKIPDAKARLKGFIESYKRLGAYGLAEPTMHEESMTQLAALQADLTELSSKFDEAMGLAASLAAGE